MSLNPFSKAQTSSVDGRPPAGLAGLPADEVAQVGLVAARGEVRVGGVQDRLLVRRGVGDGGIAAAYA